MATVLSLSFHFNSTMVRLKVAKQTELAQVRLYFNSTMVRLKDLGGHSSTVSVKFQFHYGTIKRNL